MPNVKVWNDNIYPHKEIFKGDEISIPAGEFIMMEEETAHEFKGAYSGFKRTADGAQTVESFKKIRVESSKVPKAVKLLCNACRFEAGSEKELADHTVLTHADRELVADKQLDEEIKSRKRA